MTRETIVLICCAAEVLAPPMLGAATHWSAPLPASAYLDTVSATNVPFNRARTDVRSLDVLLQFHGSVSNAVEVAFGCDADGDGALSADETDVVVGWRGGSYSLEDAVGDLRILEPAANATDADRFLQLSVGVDAHQDPIAFDAISDEGPRFCHCATPVPPRVYGSDWNIFKVTRRGVVPAVEDCMVRVGYERFDVRLR